MDRGLDGQPFNLQLERKGEIAFVRLSGELYGDCGARIHKCLGQLADEGASVRIDLRGVTFIDPDGLRVLVKHQLDARIGGFDLTLIPPTGSVRRVFDLLGADRVFTISDGAAAAQRASAGLGTHESEPTDWLFGAFSNA
jgi:anti-anti-sigma factor